MNTKPISAAVPGVPGAELREVSWLPETLEGAVRVGGFSVARPGALLHIVPDVARYLVTDGKLIEMVRDPGADPLAVEQFLFGSARAALVHQRGGLPLHAACLAPPEGEFAVALTGQSGAGKSTLATELVRRGWKLLGDDVTPLYGDAGGVMAWPSKGGVKLWRDACEHFSIGVDRLRSLPGERDKYLLPVDTHAGPLRLGHIFSLHRSPDSAGRVETIAGPERFSILATNTYKFHYLAGMGCAASHFRIACGISEQVGMARLHWKGAVNEGADLLTAHCRN